MNSCVPEEITIPVPLAAPVVLLLNDTDIIWYGNRVWTPVCITFAVLQVSDRYIDKIKNKIYHTVGTVLKSNRNSERGKIYSPSRYIMVSHFTVFVHALE